ACGLPLGRSDSPTARGSPPVNIAAWDGNVQFDVEIACSTALPDDASWDTVGVDPAGAPHGSNADARAVSNTTKTMLGFTAEPGLRQMALRRPWDGSPGRDRSIRPRRTARRDRR